MLGVHFECTYVILLTKRTKRFQKVKNVTVPVLVGFSPWIDKNKYGNKRVPIK
jgi:hypothetical protein